MTPVYLDYAATTPVDPRVLTAMQQAMEHVYGNASSVYAAGREAREYREAARRDVAALIGAKPADVFFTSGGSESDNWALKGLAFARRAAGLPCGIVTSAIEHPAVLQTCAWLKEQGFDVKVLPVESSGRVAPETLEAVLSSSSVYGIVSIMLANNEVGTIEPVHALAEIAHHHGAVFHTDGVQAVGHIPVDVEALGVDALSLAGHKFYGPKGTGALYVRRGTAIDSLVHGGAQERGLRAGTEAVPALVGLGCAARLAKQELAVEAKRLAALRTLLWQEISAIPGSFCNSPLKTAFLPGTLNFGMEGIRHDALLIRLDLAGFAISAGSACSAGSLEPSHVLLAMGTPKNRAVASLRVTLGRWTTEDDIHAFACELKKAAAAIRRVEG